MAQPIPKISVYKVLWAVSIAIVFSVGVYCFPREYPELGLVESIYYTIRLFVLEHDLPNFQASPHGQEREESDTAHEGNVPKVNDDTAQLLAINEREDLVTQRV